MKNKDNYGMMRVVFRNYAVIGHRGDTERYPENTLESFKDAFARGCDAVEMDVHLTSDGYVVVHHDFSIRRMTGVERIIEESEYSDIKKAKINGKYRIPLLENVFREFPDQKLFVELKTVTDDGRMLDNGLENAVYKLVREFGRFENTIVISFNPVSLESMKDITKEIALGLDFDRTSLKYIGEVNPSDLKEMGITAFLPEVNSVEMKRYRIFAESGIDVFPWPVDSRESAIIAVENGASGIITNRCYDLLSP